MNVSGFQLLPCSLRYSAQAMLDHSVSRGPYARCAGSRIRLGELLALPDSQILV